MRAALLLKGGTLATAEQVISLVRAHGVKNDEKFRNIVLQIAAHESKSGHEKTAEILRNEAENIKRFSPAFRPVPPPPSMMDPIELSAGLDDLVVSDTIRISLLRVIEEYQSREVLCSKGLHARRKLLLEGDPGTGKTMSASVLAKELGLPLYSVQMDMVFSQYMGEAGRKLRQVFEYIANSPVILLFDEFDALGTSRGICQSGGESGEMRRVLDSFLQFFERDCSESIIIAATNTRNVLDRALFRRFDDVICYSLPDRSQIRSLIAMKLGNHAETDICTDAVLDAAMGLNHADIVHACEDAVKESVLHGTELIPETLVPFLNGRKSIYKKPEGSERRDN